VGIRLQVEVLVLARRGWRTPHPCEVEMEAKVNERWNQNNSAYSRIPEWIVQSHSFYAKLSIGLFDSISSRSTSKYYERYNLDIRGHLFPWKELLYISFISKKIYFLLSSSSTQTPWNSSLNLVVCMRLKACLIRSPSLFVWINWSVVFG